MVRSSLPFSSPLMITDLPIFTVFSSPPRFVSTLVLGWGRAASAAAWGAAGVTGAGAGAGAGCGALGFAASSRFHMWHSPRVRKESSAGCLALPPAQQSGVYARPFDPV